MHYLTIFEKDNYPNRDKNTNNSYKTKLYIIKIVEHINNS